jgi:hypothetical protein
VFSSVNASTTDPSAVVPKSLRSSGMMAPFHDPSARPASARPNPEAPAAL